MAELRAAFLAADLDLTSEPRDDHAAHVASWLKGPAGRRHPLPQRHTPKGPLTISMRCSRLTPGRRKLPVVSATRAPSSAAAGTDC